ncbi:cytochrome P450 [Aspergillus leporis]|uniref:Cytochrome P450 n=1 Tax=Aspergillus leporis TaxID=41062 RepID=A0A5N5X633_9EURO|nr:cytochrome P450 [Aspergillus leporis]
MVDQIKLMNQAFISTKYNIPFASCAKQLKQIDYYNQVACGILLPQEKINGSAHNEKRKAIDNPKCLEQLRAEHDAVLGPDPQKAVEVLTETPHLIQNLPYTLAVIKKTLRLYPIESTVREGTLGYFLTTKGETTQDGWAPWAAITVIQRDPTYWPRSDEFLPERWTVKANHPLHPILKHAWLAFAIGMYYYTLPSSPRNSIGMELALTELKLVSVLTARMLHIQEAWDEWDQKQEQMPH